MTGNKLRISGGDVLIAVDIQKDFCPGGALAVPEGDRIVHPVNRVALLFDRVIMTQDWHPPGHDSFASSHPGKNPYDIIAMPYGDQVLWPDHCVQGTDGAGFHKGLSIRHCQMIIRKGFHRDIDSYSAFFENDHKTATGLDGYLKDSGGVSRLFMAGLATDFCVLYSCLDARKLGYEVYLIDDLCRGMDVDGSLEAAYKKMEQAGVKLVMESDLPK